MLACSRGGGEWVTGLAVVSIGGSAVVVDGD